MAKLSITHSKASLYEEQIKFQIVIIQFESVCVLSAVKIKVHVKKIIIIIATKN